MLRLESVTKLYGAREVLKELSWAVPREARVGLVGRNGSGKTTLLRILAGEVEPDTGRVERTRDVTFGYLPQEGARVAERTVLRALLAGFPEIARLEEELERAHEAMSRATGRELEELTRRAGELQHRLEAAGGFSIESEAKRILTGLGFAPDDHGRPLVEMSGGYRMRAALGALLLKKPDYLLLDEPTNHLDLEAMAWLEAFLGESRSAMILVSHDRVFLNRLVGSIAELDRGRVTVWTGDYDSYREQKERARAHHAAAAAQEAHRVAEVERFIERFRYKATKARQVQSRVKMLEKMKRTEVTPEERSWRFLLPPAPRCAARVLHLGGVTKRFDGRLVLDGVDLDLYRGDRVALLGPNGSGKSTLLKIAAGLLPADAGVIALGEKVALHYFAQHVIETLTPGRTVLEEMQAWSPARSPGELRSLLGVFQFTGDEVFKRIEVLSGGEKNRLALARLMLDPGNFILLDEPTNHLDLPAREALEQALARYDGALLFVSHDRYFINKVASRVAGIRRCSLEIHDGGYDAYREWAASRGEGEREALEGWDEPPTLPTRRSREARRAAAVGRNERNRRLRELRARVAAAESAIAAAEQTLDEVDARLADPQTYRSEGLARELGDRKRSAQVDLSRLNLEWEDALSELERAERAT